MQFELLERGFLIDAEMLRDCEWAEEQHESLVVLMRDLFNEVPAILNRRLPFEFRRLEVDFDFMSVADVLGDVAPQVLGPQAVVLLQWLELDFPHSAPVFLHLMVDRLLHQALVAQQSEVPLSEVLISNNFYHMSSA